MAPSIFRTIGFAFLLLNTFAMSARVDGINRMEKKHVVATSPTTGQDPTPSTISAQITTGSTHIDSSSQVTSASITLSKTPSAPTNHAATLDLSTSFHNKTFVPLQVDGHEVPISCLNCSTTGTLNVTGSRLSVNDNLIGGNDTHLFNDGLFTAALPHGLKGRIELGLNAPSTLSQTFNLSKVPIEGFVIPDVADAGVTVGISVQFSLQLSKPAQVSFGFEFEVPENSSILIDIADEQNSKVRGFGNDTELQFNILPVNVSYPGLNITLTAALILDLVIGADFHDNDIVAEVGAQLVIPVVVEERQLSHVDSKCDPLEHSNSNRSTTQRSPVTTTPTDLVPRKEPHSLVGNYTNIVPVAGIEMDVFIAAGLRDSFGQHDLALDTAFPIFKTALSLPTSCINNHKSTSVSSKASATNAAATTAQNSNGGLTTTRGQTGGTNAPSATASSAAAGGLIQGEPVETFLFMGSSAALALAIAMGWLVVNF